MATERTYYANADGVRISNTRLVFGSHTYATRSVSSAVTVDERMPVWPAYLVMLAGVAMIVWGALAAPLWTMLGALGILSGFVNLSRKKRMYGIRIGTSKGPALVLTSRSRPYVEQVVAAVHKAMAAASEAPAPLPSSIEAERTRARGRRRRR